VRGADVYDAAAKAWSRAPAPPAPPAFRPRGMVHRFRQALIPGTREHQAVAVEEPSTYKGPSPPAKLPFAATGAADRLYWFTSYGPVHFDPVTKRWGQSECDGRDRP